MDDTLRIAVLLPCRDEEASIAQVVRDFRAELPGALIHVCDNASSDATAARAFDAGALVCRESQAGKGHAVRRLFADTDADVYVLCDGDGTYDPAAAAQMIRVLRRDRLDMVTGIRKATGAAAYRRGHVFGNRMMTQVVAALFGGRFADMLSGYRVLSHRFIKSFPALSLGFEIETELTIHALTLHVPMAEMETAYRPRREGSASKLHTLRDGARILWTVLRLLKEERPLTFFGAASGAVLLSALVLVMPVLAEYIDTGLVRRFPTAILAASLGVLSFVLLTAGLILNSVTRGRIEAKRLRYLALPPPPALEGYPT